jgi:hypothetical protein
MGFLVSCITGTGTSCQCLLSQPSSYHSHAVRRVAIQMTPAQRVQRSKRDAHGVATSAGAGAGAGGSRLALETLAPPITRYNLRRRKSGGLLVVPSKRQPAKLNSRDYHRRRHYHSESSRSRVTSDFEESTMSSSMTFRSREQALDRDIGTDCPLDSEAGPPAPPGVRTIPLAAVPAGELDNWLRTMLPLRR